MKISKKRLQEIIKEEIALFEARRTQWQIPVMDKLKVDKIVKKLRMKIGRDYDIGVGRGSTFILEVDPRYKHKDKLLELLMKLRIRVKEL